MDEGSNQVVEDAARHLRGAMAAAGWLDAFAWLAAISGAVAFLIALIGGLSEQDPAVVAVGVAALLGSVFGWAMLKGFAAVLWLMSDRILVAAEDEDD